jgi:hypothetical protein
MMEDGKVAKAFLSAIIGEKVEELDVLRGKRVYKDSDRQKKVPEHANTFFSICNFDFCAKIALPEGGYRTTVIELQKAKFASDIMRFRRYSEIRYKNPDDEKDCQIYSIFLLCHDTCIPGHPVIRVDYNAQDTTTLMGTTNEFIQSLHNRSWIIQVEQIRQPYRNDLEKMLSIFDQENFTKEYFILNYYILNVSEEEDFPEEYRPVIRRLRIAGENMRIEMEMEDDYIKELQDKERIVAQLYNL